MASWKVYVTKYKGTDGSVLWTRQLLSEACASAVVPGWRSGLFVVGGVVYADIAANPNTGGGPATFAGLGTGGDGHQQFALVRRTEAGARDATFGAGGLAMASFGTNSDSTAYALALQGDGSYVAAGFTGAVFALARFDAAGVLDPGFGTGGLVTTAFGSLSDQAQAVLVQADGKVVAAGFTTVAGVDARFAVARYNANGTLDAGFGTGGKATTDFTAGDDEAHALVVQADGKVVAVGATATALGVIHFALARYNTDGSLDSGFGAGGKVTTDFGTGGGNDQAFGAVLQRDGKIVAAGLTVDGSGNFRYALARYNADGSLDSGFGTGGKVVTDPGTAADYVKALALQGDGKLVGAGTAADQTDAGLARYDTAGVIDTTFNTTGLVDDDINGPGFPGGTANAVVAG